MPDREKVIRGLECCMKWTGEPNTATCHCSDCSYTNMDILGERCLIDLINDALDLLNEQEEQKFLVDSDGKITPLPVIVRCKDCDNKECWGRAGDVVCGIDGTPHRPDWYCADGERQEGR